MAQKQGSTGRMRAALVGTLMAAPLAMPAPTAAHPHIWVDAGLEVYFDDQGRLAALRITWVYDEFFSMLMLSDLELDSGFSGELTPEDHEALQGFDMNWIEGYHGDVFVTLDGEALDLTGPLEWTSELIDDQLVSTHLRALEERVTLDGAELRIEVYDPTYYTSYRIVGTPTVQGRADCRVRIFEPDWDAADAQLQAALDEMLGDGMDEFEIEADFPAVGRLFADEARITCAGSS